MSGNPYDPGAASSTQRDSPRSSDKLRLRLVQYYWKHREQDPTLLEIARQRIVHWLVLTAYVGIVAYLSFRLFPGLHSLFYFVAGMVVGAILKDVSSYRSLTKVWSVLREIIDWGKVEQLRDELESR